jgi:carbonic anhydrase/acetyltransferase-like protein (isoleucine patch superfamily)
LWLGAEFSAPTRSPQVTGSGRLLGEIGNGAILMPGARLVDGCILGEGALAPASSVIPHSTVLVGRPLYVLGTPPTAPAWPPRAAARSP